MKLGIAISDQERPNTHSFSFMAERSSNIHRGMYVKAKISDDRHAIGMIAEIRKLNIYFSDANDVNAIGNMADAYPIAEGENIIADVDIFGIIDKGRFRRSTTSVSPGTEVFMADNSMLKSFFGFEESGMGLGKIDIHELDVNFNIERMFQKHMAILAMSGAGKSYLTKVILEEMLSNENAPAVVVLDMHGEYSDFAEDKSFGNKAERISGGSVRMGVSDLSTGIIRELYPDTTEVQEDLFDSVFSAVYEKQALEKVPQEESAVMGIIQSLEDAEESKAKKSSYGVIKRRINAISKRSMIGKQRFPDLISKVQLGKMLVFDFSDVESSRSAVVKGYFIIKQLFELRKKGAIPPVVVFVEEAHNFAPEKAEKRENVTKAQIERIAREGRKFGISICLITQRPAHLSQTSLSQCNTHIFLRIANPNDLDFIRRGSEGLTGSLIGMLPGLEVGEAVVVGEAVKSPLIFRVREKRVKDGKRTGMLDMISEWKQKSKGKRDEFSEFL